MNVFIDSATSVAERRTELYAGSVFVYSLSPCPQALCEFARELIEVAFRPFDPRTVQNELPVGQWVEILTKLKLQFIHHSRSKELIQKLLMEQGCDLNETYFDVPRLRTAFPSDYLAAGIAYAFHPHRDTWYSAPFAQINWWLPVYEFTPINGMAFHTQYWATPVPNSSSGHNYYARNRTNRQSASSHVKADTRIQPRAQISLEPDPQTRLVVNVGGAILFSAAQPHSTVRNSTDLTRYSIDFRVVNLKDLCNRRGAANIDSSCTGTSLRDYLRASDFTRIPDQVVSLYLDGSEADFTPSPSSASVSAVTIGGNT